MHRLYVLGLLFALSFMSSVPRAHAANSPAIILSEIAWAGSAQSTADEWIELANIGAEPVPLGGWQLTGVGTSDSVLTIPTETFLGAGSTYLISNYALGDPKSTLNIPSNLVTTVVSIPNTALDITLIDSGGATVDRLIDPGTPDSGSSATFTSMERVLTDLSWASAETSTNLLNGQLGSPGVISHALAVPIEVAPIEEAIIEDEIPFVTEPVTDPAPAVTEESVVEITPEPVIDPVVETPIEEVPIEPAVVSETPETPAVTETLIIEDPATAEIVNEIPVAIEAAPVETPDAVESTTTEETTSTPIISATAETAEAEESVPPTPSAPALATLHPGDIVISALFPSPNTGDDEWVALTNTTDVVINLSGITLVDASGAVTALSDTIGANATIYVLNPKGKLNNESDAVSLLDGTGIVISYVEYGTDAFPAPKKRRTTFILLGVD